MPTADGTQETQPSLLWTGFYMHFRLFFLIEVHFGSADHEQQVTWREASSGPSHLHQNLGGSVRAVGGGSNWTPVEPTTKKAAHWVPLSACPHTMPCLALLDFLL